ncbi:DUF4328 domain-containing protein [Myroides sp. LJL116]
MNTLKPNGKRAKNAITLIWIMLILDIASIISKYFQYEIIQTIANGDEITEAMSLIHGITKQITGLLYMVAYVTSIITFIQWFRRAYYNLHQRVSNLSYSEGWATSSWFVPILNLFRPYQIMQELYFQTNVLLIKKGIPLHHILNTSIIGFWWAFWILSNLFGLLVFRYALQAESTEEFITSILGSMFNSIIGIPLALLTIKVIRNYAKVEPLLLENEQEPTNN